MSEKIKGIVRSVTEPKVWDGVLQIGFLLQADPNKWYNIQGDEERLKQIKELILKKGNEIEFDLDIGQVTNIKVITEAKEEEKEAWEDDIVNFETLLKAAHDQKEMFSIQTECLNIDLEKKYALFKATITIEKVNIGEAIKDLGTYTRVFQGHGDATAENVKGDFIKPHFIRMAETRAIVRALRWYTNNAKCAEEEKSEETI